jgi:hypothetical protein
LAGLLAHLSEVADQYSAFEFLNDVVSAAPSADLATRQSKFVADAARSAAGTKPTGSMTSVANDGGKTKRRQELSAEEQAVGDS